MPKCYICNKEIEEKEIIYTNIKWGDSSVKIEAKVIAEVCSNCGKQTVSMKKSRRLQKLSKSY